MDKVAIYARVSTADGKQSYTRQISELESVIINHGYKKEQIEIYAEMLSGYQKDRPELTKLLNNIENEPTKYKTIYCSEISRIGRNPKNTREIIDRWIELGVPLYIQSIGQSTIDSNGKKNIIVSIILQVLMEFADLESETMKTRMKSGKLKRAKDGKTSNNNLPYGYTSDDNGYIIIDSDESQIITQIFETYQSGIGTRVIANTLNQMKVPTKLNKTKSNQLLNFNKETSPVDGDSLKWSDVVIGQILKNTIYKGERNYKGTKIEIEPIVSPELFDECNELLSSKSSRNYLTSYSYLLKDLIRCGCCGRVYMGKYVNKVKGDKVYKCTSYLKSGEGCGNRSINMSLIESVFYNEILNSETLLKSLDNPNDIINQIKKELKQQEQLLKNEQKLLLAKEKQIENLLRTTTLSSNPNLELYAKLEGEILNEIELLKTKISLITKDIFSKHTTIQNFNIEATSRDMIVKAKDNRPELITIYKQFIKSINLNDLGNGYVLANATIIINGVKMIRTLKLFIYADGVRKYGGRNEKTYKYLATTKFENDPVYKDNILMNDINDIKSEFEYLVSVQDDTTGLTHINKFINIEKENRLHINEFDL